MGRRQVLLIGVLFAIAFGIPVFMLINTGAVILVIVAISLSLLFSHDPSFAMGQAGFQNTFRLTCAQPVPHWTTTQHS